MAEHSPMTQFNNLEQLSSVRTKINQAIDKTDGAAAMAVFPGTVSTPGLQFAGDTNTGFANPTPDTITILTGGSERMRVHSSGGVSIGSTADPGANNTRVTNLIAETVTATGAATLSGTITLNGQVGAGGASYGNSGQVLTSRGAGLSPTWAAAFPSGGIILWSGSVASIPAGWYLCNGANGTPNLQDRFIVGAGSGYNPGETGGAASVTLSLAQIPAHDHAFSGTTSIAGAHTHTYETPDLIPNGERDNNSQFGNTTSPATTSSAGAHAHTFSGVTTSVGGGAAIENRPPYYALCYIMKA